MTAPELFEHLLQTNNLTCSLAHPRVRFIENGGMVIDSPFLQIAFTVPQKDLPSVDQSAVIPEEHHEQNVSENPTPPQVVVEKAPDDPTPTAA